MMRPITLKGHERSLTQVKFNREGDLLLSVSKDHEASIWYSSNGERLGTLVGHHGAIWTIDVDPETKYFVTGSADMTAILWKAETGEKLHTWVLESPVRRVEFSPNGTQVALVTDAVMGEKGSIYVFDINFDSAEQSNEPVLCVPNPTQDNKSKLTVISWSYGGKYLITGHADGTICQIDPKTGEILKSVSDHTGIITDIQHSQDRTYFITASKDQSGHIYDDDNLNLMKTFKADTAMNSAAITPVKDFVILGGGQDARSVTTTASSEGKFEARFYHKIFEDEIGRVKGHFGPLNYVVVHPKGTCYASGGEDGYIRLHYFVKSYFDFLYDVEKTAAAAASAAANAATEEQVQVN